MSIDNNSTLYQDYGLSENAYSCGYSLRLKYASFMQDTIDWFAEHYLELFSGRESKVLSLGCGSGILDLEIIKIIQQKNNSENKLDFTGLDYNLTDIDQFHESLAHQTDEIKSSVTLKYQKFEASTDLGKRFDLITMVHFLHSFEDVLPIIKNALKHLSPHGKLLIIHQQKKGILELKKTFLDILHNQKFQSTDQFKTALKSSKIDFMTHPIDTYFDVTVMQEMSLDTLLLMSFCLCNDLSRLTRQQQDKIRNTFLSFANAQGEDKFIIYEPMEAIVCSA